MIINEFNPVEALVALEMQKIQDSIVEDPAEVILGLISKTMGQAETGILTFDRIEDDEFISSSKLKEIASRATINNKAFLAECEALMATSQVVSSIMAGLEKNALTSCANASEAVRVLLAYHSALGNTGRSVLVIPSHLKGTHSIIGDSVTSEIVTGSDARARVTSFQSNGQPGNFLEIAPGVDTRVALDGAAFRFADSEDTHRLPSSITDGDELSMFEVEGYVVNDVVSSIVNSRNIMPTTRVKVQMADRSGSEVNMVPLDWSRFDSSDGLYVDVLMQTASGAISAINIKTAERTDVSGMSIPLPSVERVDISIDGKIWQSVPCRYDAISSAAGGEILVHVNAGTASFLRVRLRQSSSYATSVMNAGHWFIPKNGSGGHWMIGDTEPVFKIGLHNKVDWFRPTLLRDVDGNLIERRVFAVPSDRYSISIREVRAEVYRYASETVVESSEYRMPAPIESVMLRVSEIVPDGTSISYEISPDNGGSWIPATPVERSGQGAEVILFSTGGYSNPNVQSARYVSVKKYPTSLRVRARLSATDSKAPSFQNLSIEPTFAEE